MTPNSPNSSPELTTDPALAHFTEYFVRNYPGPNTIIGNPYWHAPRIFGAAKYAIEALSSKNELPASAPPVMGMEEMVERLMQRLKREAANRNSAYDRFGMDNTPQSVDPELFALLEALSTPLVTGRDEQDGANAACAAPRHSGSAPSRSASRPSGECRLSQEGGEQ